MTLWLFIVYLHCIKIQRIYIRYDDMADYLHYIQLQFGIEPSEGSWRSKERHIFIIKGPWFIELSPIENVKTRFQKEWYLYFHSLCTICHKKLCTFLPRKKKDDWYDMMGYNLGKYTGKQICIKPVKKQTNTKVRKKVVNVSAFLGRRRRKVVKVSVIQTDFNSLILREAFCVVKFLKGVSN